jgi:uncharacterized protein YceH (UPF0502 family)
MMSDVQSSDSPASRRWRPLESIERRVLGVLIEKAKTTPEAYPLSINAVRTACNQKSNRAPFMQLEEEQVEEALEHLRKSGAVSQIQGGARIDRYRHLAYEWLGVEKVELAVMAELLLRGAQTVGELRGRAARMEPIKDLGELQPTLDSLAAKGLIMYLTPPGRGCVVSHALYLDRELDKVRREAGAAHLELCSDSEPAAPRPGEPPPAETRRASLPSAVDGPVVKELASELENLREEFNEVKRELAAARAEFESTAGELRRDLEELNRQLGN